MSSMKYYMNIYNILLKKIIMMSGELFQQKTRLSASVSWNRKGGEERRRDWFVWDVCWGGRRNNNKFTGEW